MFFRIRRTRTPAASCRPRGETSSDSRSEALFKPTRCSSSAASTLSKSGSNKFHGSLFEYHRNNKLTARNVFQNTPNPNTGRILPASRRNEFGFSVGGPIQTDKMFFFGSLDTLRSSDTVTNRITLETPGFVNFMKTRFPNNISTLLLTKYPVGDIGPVSVAQTVADYM